MELEDWSDQNSYNTEESNERKPWRNRDAREPLHRAAMFGDVERVRKLLEEGHAVDELDDVGNTPLLAALGPDASIEILELLLDAGADVNARTDIGMTPLIVASHQGNVSAVRLFLRHGADELAADDHGFTARNRAEMNRREDVLKIFRARDRRRKKLFAKDPN